MIMKATVELDTTQLREIIVKYFEQEGVKNVSHQDIQFKVEAVERGDQRDPFTVYELTGVSVKNIKIGAIK